MPQELVFDCSSQTESVIEASPTPVPVPRSVSPLQMRKALRQAGLKVAVDAFLASAPDEVIEEWEYATQIDRDNASLAAAAAGLGMSEANLDQLFILAGTLE